MAPHFDQPIEPMTLGNMRELGVRSLAVYRAAEGRQADALAPTYRATALFRLLPMTRNCSGASVERHVGT
jgi:hypothetical protein